MQWCKKAKGANLQLQLTERGTDLSVKSKCFLFVPTVTSDVCKPLGQRSPQPPSHLTKVLLRPDEGANKEKCVCTPQFKSFPRLTDGADMLLTMTLANELMWYYWNISHWMLWVCAEFVKRALIWALNSSAFIWSVHTCLKVHRWRNVVFFNPVTMVAINFMQSKPVCCYYLLVCGCETVHLLNPKQDRNIRSVVFKDV